MKEQRCLLALRALTILTSSLSIDCDRLHRRVQNNRNVTLPSIAQNNSKRTTEHCATHARTEGIGSIARDCEEVRSEAHVRHTSNKCSTDPATSERDRAKDVKQFDDILTTFVYETKTLRTGFGKREMRQRCSNSGSSRLRVCWKLLIALENITIDKVSNGPVSWKREYLHECSNGDWKKKRNSESWTSHCRLCTKEQAKELGVLVVENRTSCSMVSQRKATPTCILLMKTRAKPLRKHLTLMKSCNCSVCWKKAQVNSGKK